MYQLILLSLLSFLISIQCSTNTTQIVVTTTSAMITSASPPFICTYCQSMACRCSSDHPILNCSSYLLHLTPDPTCSDTIEWDLVDFSSRNLEKFDSTKLLSLRTRRLSLKSNFISMIADETFDSIADILIELDLEINQLSTLTSRWLNSKMSQLKILNIAFNQVESLMELQDVELPSLRVLNISWNQFETFPNEIRQWKSLTTLDLSFNKLNSLPRFALIGLDELTWLSLASNRYLNCFVQDSFKYLKSLKYLDVSSTNLLDLDPCIFIPLSGLQTLKIEHVTLNCSSCWLPVAKTNSINLFGQCVQNRSLVRLNSLTNEQLSNACSKTSIECSKNECESNTIDLTLRLVENKDSPDSTNDDARQTKNRTIEIVLAIIFSLIAAIMLIIFVVMIYRYRTGKQVFCCDFISTRKTSSYSHQNHKQAIKDNPAIIESIITHGANMNTSSYTNENTLDTKRKLYNPMFSDSPQSEHQRRVGSNDTTCSPHPLYSENL